MEEVRGNGLDSGKSNWLGCENRGWLKNCSGLQLVICTSSSLNFLSKGRKKALEEQEWEGEEREYSGEVKPSLVSFLTSSPFSHSSCLRPAAVRAEAAEEGAGGLRWSTSPWATLRGMCGEDLGSRWTLLPSPSGYIETAQEPRGVGVP